MTSTSSRELFAEAVKIIPGGVNSPVRAFGSVGGSPRFIARAEGARVWDVEGNSYIDYVGSWGPLILGHAHAETRGRGLRGGAARPQLRRADGGRGDAREDDRRANPLDPDGPAGELRHRGDDDGAAGRAGLHPPREGHQVLRLLSRPFGRVPGEGGFRRGHAGRADEPGRPGRGRRANGGGRVQRPGRSPGGFRGRARARSPPSSSSRSAGTPA